MPRSPILARESSNSYLGLGKSAGDVVRGGKEDDQGSINSAVQSALNDPSGKIENALRLRQ